MSADRATLPTVQLRVVSADTARFELHVPPGLAWFDGHFDDTPVIPGVVLVHWAAQYAAEAFGPVDLSGELRNLKFRRLLLPGTDVTLTLELDRTRLLLAFGIRSNAGNHASGTFVMAAG